MIKKDKELVSVTIMYIGKLISSSNPNRIVNSNALRTRVVLLNNASQCADS